MNKRVLDAIKFKIILVIEYHMELVTGKNEVVNMQACELDGAMEHR